MPLVEVTLGVGRSPQQLRDLVSALTRAVNESIDAPVANVRVIIREVPLTHFAAGDVTLAERAAAAATPTDDTRHTESDGTASGRSPAGEAPR